MFYLLLECRYDDGAWYDCDPIKLTKWRQKHLLAGASYCEKIKNETKGCDVSDFPPGKQEFATSAPSKYFIKSILFFNYDKIYDKILDIISFLALLLIRNSMAGKRA